MQVAIVSRSPEFGNCSLASSTLGCVDFAFQAPSPLARHGQPHAGMAVLVNGFDSAERAVQGGQSDERS